MKVTYTSCDGRTFETEEECIKYENFLSQKPRIAKDIILDSLRRRDDGGSVLEELEKLVSFIEIFDEKIGFENLRGIEESVRVFFEMYSSAVKSLSRPQYVAETTRDVRIKIKELVSLIRQIQRDQSF